MFNNISKVRIYSMIRDQDRTLAVDFEDNKHENQESSILLNVIISLYVSRTSNQIYFFLVFFFSSFYCKIKVSLIARHASNQEHNIIYIFI